MKSYLEEAIEESARFDSRAAATPARKNIFEVDATAAPLSKAEAESFHSVVAKLVYCSAYPFEHEWICYWR